MFIKNHPIIVIAAMQDLLLPMMPVQVLGLGLDLLQTVTANKTMMNMDMDMDMDMILYIVQGVENEMPLRPT